jgi:hypothetical protein
MSSMNVSVRRTEACAHRLSLRLEPEQDKRQQAEIMSKRPSTCPAPALHIPGGIAAGVHDSAIKRAIGFALTLSAEDAR